jgi:hypothetical protein
MHTQTSYQARPASLSSLRRQHVHHWFQKSQEAPDAITASRKFRQLSKACFEVNDYWLAHLALGHVENAEGRVPGYSRFAAQLTFAAIPKLCADTLERISASESACHELGFSDVSITI